MRAESQMLADRPSVGDLERLQENWGLMLGMGVALIVLGILVINEPFVATWAVMQMMGVLLMLGGIFQLASSFWGRQWRGFFLHLLAGVVYLIVGVFMIARTDEATAAFTLLVAGCLLVGGLFRILVAAFQRFDGWGWVLLNGVVSVFLGAAIWRHWPSSAEWVIGLFVGIEMLFSGWSWVMLALRLRSLPKGRLAA
jgi:uncharacterized membrane protein HdeD (DUF308 family)